MRRVTRAGRAQKLRSARPSPSSGAREALHGIRRRKALSARPALLSLLLFLSALVWLPAPASAKIYIDITSPNVKKMPVAIVDFDGPGGNQLSQVVRDDLSFTGLFLTVEKASNIESSSQPFNPKNWAPLGIEAVAKGIVTEGGNISATVTLYDAFEGKGIFTKQYQAGKDQLRRLGHVIANDIYSALTGAGGIFKTKIAFVGEDKSGKGLFFMDWDGHGVKRFALKANLALIPHWSPDGARIIYASERGRQWGLYLLNFVTMTEKRVFVSKGINIAGDFFPDGKSFVFSSSREGTPDLYVFNLENNNIRRISSSYGIDVSASVSPDGREVAFVSDRGGSPQVYVMRADGSEVRRVTFEGSYNTSPCWSSRGDRIAFSGRRGGRNQIFIVKPDGSELTQLTEIGNNEDPSFSPDGRYITFSSDRDRTKGIYIMRANGEGQKRVSSRDLKAFGPRWSPN